MRAIIKLLSMYVLLVLSIQTHALVDIVVLGVAQDAGYPQANCYQEHCMKGWRDVLSRKGATSLAVIDHKNNKKYIFEATPNMPEQLYALHQLAPDNDYKLDGVFLTHAHIGHYAGLMFLGRESANTKEVPVYAMPKMTQFLSTNGPWQQLVLLNNIKLNQLNNDKKVKLSSQLAITPLIVPHRDEYSETVGYFVEGQSQSALFIPDIDKWEKWQESIVKWIEKVDYAFLDATFFSKNELPNRNIEEVPHPLVSESMSLFNGMSKENKAKVYFIHFNHTNPLLDLQSKEAKHVLKSGYNISTEGMILKLN